MKNLKSSTAFRIALLLLFGHRANGQGTITFANYGVTPQGQSWSVPVCGLDGVTPLGSPYEVCVFLGATPNSLTLIPGSTAPIMSGGLFSGITFTSVNMPAGDGAEIKVAVWNSTYGNSYFAARGNGSPGGAIEFRSTLGSSSSPGTFYGMPTLQLAGPVPEPGVMVLFGLDGLTLACRAVGGCKASEARNYKRFLAKARPEGDFGYRSNAAAFSRSRKAIAVLTRHGRCFDVCGTSPRLWGPDGLGVRR